VCTLLTGCSSYKFQIDLFGSNKKTKAQEVRRLAESSLRQGRPLDAAILLSGLEAEEADDDSRRREALAWVMADKIPQAERVLQLPGVADSSGGQLLLAVIAWKISDEDAALAAIRQSLDYQPDNPGTLALLAEFLIKREDLVGALEVLAQANDQLQNRDPLKPFVLHNMAITSFALGDYAGADAAYSEYVALMDRLKPDEVLMAGAMAYAVADHDRAVNHWEHLDVDTRTELARRLGNDAEQYASLAP
jgi:tetratricopeptide (TPR) repeat protein